MTMKDIPDLGVAQRDFKAAADLCGEEKLGAMRRLLATIHEFELCAAADFSISFDTVKGFRDLLRDVQPAVNMLEATARRKK